MSVSVRWLITLLLIVASSLLTWWLTKPEAHIASLTQPAPEKHASHPYPSVATPSPDRIDGRLGVGTPATTEPEHIARRLLTTLETDYQQLSGAEIDQLEQRFFNSLRTLIVNANHTTVRELLKSYLTQFQHPDAFYLLGLSASATKHGQRAVEAFFEAAKSEYRPERLKTVMQALATAAMHYSSELQKQQKIHEVHELYLKLYNQFPGEAEFQFQLAQSYLALGQPIVAGQYLQAMTEPGYQYQTEKLLKAIDEQTSAATLDKQDNQQKTKALRAGQIAIPLLVRGNQFFVNAQINNRRAVLLLDTGASISSLSPAVIEQIGLRDSGQTVALNTANGRFNSELYTARSFSMGNVRLQNIKLARINIDESNRIQGLLGTDILNHFHYSIDNQSNTLLLSRKLLSRK